VYAPHPTEQGEAYKPQFEEKLKGTFTGLHPIPIQPKVLLSFFPSFLPSKTRLGQQTDSILERFIPSRSSSDQGTPIVVSSFFLRGLL
jgi:hypothetical protein